MASRVLFYVFLLAVATRSLHGNESTTAGSMLSFIKEPEDSIVGRSESLWLSCSVGSSAAANESHSLGGTVPVTVAPPGTGSASNVTWFHNGRPVLVPDPRRRILNNGTLFFDKVLPKRPGRASFDEGNYYCVVSNEFGSLMSGEASVRVATLAQDFTLFPSDITTEAKSVARFRCHIDSVPEAEIVWEKDGAPLSVSTPREEANDTARFVLLPSGVLQIHHVQPEDAGNYRCVATNGLAARIRRSSSAALTVVPRADVDRNLQFLNDNHNQELWISEGKDAWLECLARSVPLPRVWWTFNGTNVTDLVEKVSVRRGYLFLCNVDSALTGEYTCHASVGNRTLSQTTKVRTAELPHFVLVPKSQVFPTARTVRFECGISGNPLPTVKWYKDGRALPIGGRIKQRTRAGGSLSELVLSNTVTADSGLYQCVAKNPFGTVSAAARLLVNISEGRPDPPANIHAVPVSPTEILLTWDPPANVPAEEITAYTVHYMQTQGGEELQEVALNSSFRFDRLLPFTNYTFYVRAYSRKSASDQSERVTCVTGVTGDPIGGASTNDKNSNFSLTAISPTSLKVTWPRTQLTNGQSKLHRVQYRRHKQSDYLIEVVKGDVNEYVITGLHPGKKYDVRFIPSGLRINASDSALPWVTKEMPTGRNSAPLIQLVSANSSSIRVSWQPSGSGRKQPVGYRIFYRKEGTRLKGPVTLPASGDRNYVIGGLSPNSLYEVQVLTVYEEGDGSTSGKYIRTLGNILEEPGDVVAALESVPMQIEVELITSKTVKISWNSATPLADLSFFTVKFQASDSLLERRFFAIGGREQPVGYLRTTQSEAEITGLLPYTAYKLFVRYHDTNGRFSKFTSGIDFQTLPEMPSAPQKLSYATEKNLQLELHWEVPQNPNGVIISYQIHVSDDPTFPAESLRVVDEPGSNRRTVVKDLVPDTLYYVRARAKNTAGFGIWTELLVVHVQAEKSFNIHPKHQEDSGNASISDHQLEIVIGLAVGVIFTLLLTVAVLWRSRCVKRLSADRHRRTSSGPVVSSSNGLHKTVLRKNQWKRKKRVNQNDIRSSSVEMESFTPMLATIPIEISGHIDTKGGYLTVSRRDFSLLVSNELDQQAAARTSHHSEDDYCFPEDPDDTCLTRATEDTCLNTSVSMNHGLGTSSPPHSHNNSLQSLGACTDQSHRSEDSNRNWSDDNDTGICSVGPSTRVVTTISPDLCTRNDKRLVV